MVLKYLFSFLFSAICVFSFSQNNLFFTDTYNTNIYKNQENTIVFSNNLFAILDQQRVEKVDSLFQVYFSNNNIQIEKNYTKNDYQFIYHYSPSNINYIDWSRNWFQQYESHLLEILNTYTFSYLKTINDTFPSIHQAALYKLSLNTYYNYNNRINDATRTSININSKTVNITQFNKTHILPNNSLKRTITSAKNNFFNESFYFSTPQNYKYFLISTNKKSRLIDCFSAHLTCNILNVSAPVYLNNLSYIQLNHIETNTFNQAAINAVFESTKKELKAIMNNSSISFYNFYDLQNLDDIIADYSINDLNKFIELYIKKNTLNEVLNFNENSTIPYNHLMLNDSIRFKVNSYRFVSQKDSIKLASIAEFLVKNPLKEIQILGLANNNEYTKVDRKKYAELIEIYQSYTPIKVSKKIDLPLYRSLIVFEYLFKKGIDPKTMICISKKVKNSEENLAFVYLKYKL